MPTLLLRLSLLIGLVGFAMGIGMGMTQNFQLMPAHAHLNLLGYIGLFLAALYYHCAPAAAESRLARIQAAFAVIGSLLLPAGVAVLLTFGPQFEYLAIIGALIAFGGMILLTAIVFKHGLPARA